MKNIFSSSKKGHNFQQSGNAIAIAVISVAVMSVAVIGVGTLILHATDKNKLAEQSKASYFAVDGMFEASMYDISGHDSGYQVTDAVSNYNRKRFGKDGKVHWTLEDRATVIVTDENVVTTYDKGAYAGFGGYMAVPSPGKGNSTSDANWNIIAPGGSYGIDLYVDNTSCTQSGVSTC